ncbi:hypothetical protein [Vibrio quintilis]|uniref:Uncharacterized protein n=1 Tax=Vibrio quintilis TaxID=1117707 RepID=A0A1M7YVF5_9VIBR|nr:hypothetical protein [Vibrio quintilis]SHO56639.1 hypothetical protein VQ7734_02408 [Vibrio quintilis]
MSNFSCYITIINNSSIEFKNGKSECSWGEYDSRPKTNLKLKDKTQFRLKDTTGPHGSTGLTKYDVGEGVIQFNYDCPYGDSSNELSFDNGGTDLTINFYGSNKAGYLDSIPDNEEGQYPSSGHPLSGIFIITD